MEFDDLPREAQEAVKNELLALWQDFETFTQLRFFAEVQTEASRRSDQEEKTRWDGPIDTDRIIRAQERHRFFRDLADGRFFRDVYANAGHQIVRRRLQTETLHRNVSEAPGVEYFLRGHP